jgi:plastocyanin
MFRLNPARLIAAALPLLLVVLGACSGGDGERVAVSPLLANGDSWSYTFEEAGTYQVQCRPHPHMRQTVHVVEPGDDAPGEPTTEVEIEGLKYRPDEIRVEAGETVTWTNYDSAGHDVTVKRSTGEG